MNVLACIFVNEMVVPCGVPISMVFDKGGRLLSGFYIIVTLVTSV